ncbi:co-chaperone YbbN [Chromobacterium sp. ASV23]|uniref:thioredoxin family protein n=1 Tax=Chromobacterium sp. ASV23 TaxID=2795110 RepID=UPI0018EC0C3D|nr:thioredoxin family protein [Chromobacterium sp. ASV23]
MKNKIEGVGVEVVKFSTSWCGPCKSYAPVFQKAAQELQGDYSFAEVLPEEVDFRSYGVASVPTTIVFVDGFEQGRRQGAMMTTEQIKQFVEASL